MAIPYIKIQRTHYCMVRLSVKCNYAKTIIINISDVVENYHCPWEIIMYIYVMVVGYVYVQYIFKQLGG